MIDEAALAETVIKIDQYMKDDAVRWHAVHARITAVTLMIVGVIDGLSKRDVGAARAIFDLIGDIHRQSQDQGSHPAHIEELAHLLRMAALVFQPAPAPTSDASDDRE